MEKIKKVFDLSEKDSLLIGHGLLFIEEELKKTKRVERYVQQSIMLSEELLVSILEAAPDRGELRISVQRDAWNVTIKISAPGEEMHIDISDDGETENDIRNMLLDSYSDKLSIKNRKGYNSVRLTVGVKAQKFAFDSFVAILIGSGLFLLTKFMFPEFVVEAMSVGFFERVSNLLLDLFGVIIPPVVFLSIISVSSKIANARSMEDDIGVKTLRRSFRSSAVAAVIGIACYSLFDSFLVDSLFAADLTATSTGALDLFDILFSLVPKNLIDPFIEGNVLQIVFMAVVIGCAINCVTDHSNAFIQVTDALYELIKKIVEAISKFVPFAIACTSFVACYKFGITVFYYLLPAVACVLVGLIAMFIIYILNIWLTTKLNPMVFLKKIGPYMVDMLRYGSGVDALPESMRFCRSKLGVASRVYNVTLPFGAQFNLDGTCIYLAVIGLSLAKLCGISMYGNNLLTMIFSIVVLSIGAPNLAGSNIICLATLLTSIGVSREFFAVIVCIDPLISLGIAVLNTVGDNVMSLCIAHQSGMLNEDVYNR